MIVMREPYTFGQPLKYSWNGILLPKFLSCLKLEEHGATHAVRVSLLS